MASQKLQGLIAAPFTPMHKDGSLNLSIIPSYYNLLKENSVNGAFICGSTGEGVSMSVTEKKAVAVAIVKIWHYMQGKLALMLFHLRHHFILNLQMQKRWHNAVQKLQQPYPICLSTIIISLF